LQKDC